MAPRPLIVRWRKDKAKRRKEQPKAFSTKAYSGVKANSRSGSAAELLHEHAIFQNRRRTGGSTEAAVQRLHDYIRKKKPHHRILYWIFNPAIRHASEQLYQEEISKEVYLGKKVTSVTASGYGIETVVDHTPPVKEEMHPKIAVELLTEMYRMQDPSLAVFDYNAVTLEKSDYHFDIMYFSGRKCFRVFRKGSDVFVSREYDDPMFLKRLAFKKVEWAGDVFKLDKESLADLKDC